MKDKSIYIVFSIIFACLQPIIWHLIFMSLYIPKEDNIGLTIACTLSTIGCAIGSIYLGQFYANDKENPW